MYMLTNQRYKLLLCGRLQVMMNYSRFNLCDDINM
jgi:hypothetical protein